MKLVLVLVPESERAPRCPQAQRQSGRLLDPELAAELGPAERAAAGALALLGQDPFLAWSGPAPFAAAAAGVDLAEDEAVYLLSPVCCAEGRVVEEVTLAPTRRRRLLAALGERLEGESVALRDGDPPLLISAQPPIGPCGRARQPLRGRRLAALPAGPPALLQRVIEASRAVCAAEGGRATHFLPHLPGRPARVTPLREAWLGLGRSAVVGESPLARALARLLCLSTWPARPAEALRVAAAEGEPYDLVVAVAGEAPEFARLPPTASLLCAARPDAGGRVSLAWRPAHPPVPAPRWGMPRAEIWGELPLWEDE